MCNILTKEDVEMTIFVSSVGTVLSELGLIKNRPH